MRYSSVSCESAELKSSASKGEVSIPTRKRAAAVVLVAAFDLMVDSGIVRDTFDDRCLCCPTGGKRVDVALSAAALQHAEKGIRRGDDARFDFPKIALGPVERRVVPCPRRTPDTYSRRVSPRHRNVSQTDAIR